MLGTLSFLAGSHICSDNIEFELGVREAPWPAFREDSAKRTTVVSKEAEPVPLPKPLTERRPNAFICLTQVKFKMFF